MSAGPIDPGRLRWQCRRGTQELDLLLQRYLDACWPAASSEQRGEFVAFLDLSDPELEQYLLKGDVLPEAPFASLAAQIRGLAFARRAAAAT
jgi:antitoxin CptB